MVVAMVYGPDRGWRLDCARTLRAAGYQVRVASTSAELMKAVAASPEALLIMDTTGDHHGATSPQLTAAMPAHTRAADESGTATATRVLAAVAGDQPTSSA